MQPVFNLFARKTGKTAMNALVFAAFFRKTAERSHTETKLSTQSRKTSKEHPRKPDLLFVA